MQTKVHVVNTFILSSRGGYMSIVWTILIVGVATLVVALPLFWIFEVILARVLIHFEPFYTPRILLSLAKYDYWWSLIRLSPPEGEFYIVLKGSEFGPYHATLPSVSDLFYNDEADRFEELPSGMLPGNQPKSALQKIGVEWVGANKYLLRRPITYNKWAPINKDATGEVTFGLVSRTRRGPSIFSQWLMAVRVHEAETRGNTKVDIILTFTVRIWVPRRAFFFEGGWVDRVTADVLGAVRTYIGARTVEELRNDGSHHVKSEMVDVVLALNFDITDPQDSTIIMRRGLMTDVGVEIRQATFVEYDPNKNDPSYQALQAEENARLNGLAKVRESLANARAKIVDAMGSARAKQIDAEADKKAMITRAEGYEKEYEARGAGNGPQIAMADAIRHGGVTAVGASVIVQQKNSEK